jgi:pimeloyl-ACP methyl ester carboxylesterase
MGTKYLSVYKSENARAGLYRSYDAILGNWPVPYVESTIETPHGRTHVILCGKEDGKPLLLFHGTGNNSLMWRYNVERLGRRHRLYLIDTINDPGKSQAPAGFDPATGYAAWVGGLLDGLGIGRASLLGHSKGGWIALNTVIAMPDRVDKVILLAPAAGINEKLVPGFMRKSLWVGLFPSVRNVASYLRYMSGTDRPVNARYAEYLSTLIRGTRTRIVKHRRFTDPELMNIENPVLLIFGENEVGIDYRTVIERAKRLVKHLDVHVVPGAGHGLQGDTPDEVDSMIIGFLDEH